MRPGLQHGSRLLHAKTFDPARMRQDRNAKKSALQPIWQSRCHGAKSPFRPVTLRPLLSQGLPFSVRVLPATVPTCVQWPGRRFLLNHVPRVGSQRYTVTDVLPAFPALSLAVAVIVCLPTAAVVAFQMYETDAALPVYFNAPSTYSEMEATPTLSVAEAWIVTLVPTFVPFHGAEMCATGGVVSADVVVVVVVPFDTVTLTVADVVTCPAAS